MADKGINILIQESEEITIILGAVVRTARGKQKFQRPFYSLVVFDLLLFYLTLII